MEPNTTPAPVVAQDTVITDATPVRLNLRTVISLIVGVVTLVLGSAGGYYALAGTEYARFSGTKVLCPDNPAVAPSAAALGEHRKRSLAAAGKP